MHSGCHSRVILRGCNFGGNDFVQLSDRLGFQAHYGGMGWNDPRPGEVRNKQSLGLL